MRSLRRQLFMILVVPVGFVWLAASLWVSILAHNELEDMLDARMMSTAQNLRSLFASGSLVLSPTDVKPIQRVPPPTTGNETMRRRVLWHFWQIWSPDGKLLSYSSGTPTTPLTETDGFSTRHTAGADWRLYSVKEGPDQPRIIIGDVVEARGNFVDRLMLGLLLPGLMLLPALTLGLWGSLGRGLRPVHQLRAALAQRGADALQPIAVPAMPEEIAPVVDAMNDLLEKLVAARAHEASITAFAAHELRTPLAALKTQVQVVLAAPTPEIRTSASRQIIAAIDRTARLVNQLLELSRLDAQLETPLDQWLQLGDAVQQVARDIVPPGDRRLEIDPILTRCTAHANLDMLHLVLRNLTENALQYCPPEGRVRWSCAQRGAEAWIILEDDGPGIPEDELRLVTDRFYRGRNRSAFGSGLGLALVDLALRRDGARLLLENRHPGPGLRACVILPAERVSGFPAAESAAGEGALPPA